MTKEKKNVIKQNLIVIFGAIGAFSLGAIIMGVWNNDSYVGIVFMSVMFLGILKLVIDAIKTDDKFFNEMSELTDKKRKEHDDLIKKHNIPAPLRWFV